MTVKRFVGATARDCLRKVKEDLGLDAVVVSNKPMENGGVEILAMSPDSLDALSQGVTSAPPAPMPPATATPFGVTATAQSARPAPPRMNAPVENTTVRRAPAAPVPPPATSTPAINESDDDYRVLINGARRQAAAARSSVSASGSAPEPTIRPWVPPGMVPKAAAPSMPGPGEQSRLRPLPRDGDQEDILPASQVAAHLRSAAQAAEREPRIDGQDMMGEAPTPQVSALMEEMRTIKSLLEKQLAGFAWGELARESPLKALLLAEMMETGFSSMLSRRLIQEMPDNAGEEEARRWLRASVNRRLRTLPADADFIDRGGVYALVGPTGVGKTTTTAKLAARCVVRYGADRLALLTTDGYRIGAHEQLRIYGRILGVPVYVVRDGDDLRRTLADLRDKHMVLIDTVGMSQRDRMVAEQAALLSRSGQVNRLLLLNAGARGDLLDDVVRAYAGENLAGCILTKVDEAPSLAPALDCIVRHGLTLTYVANGQRVPEDLHLPNRTYLLHRAFKVSQGETAHTVRQEEMPLAMTTPPVSAPVQGYPVGG